MICVKCGKDYQGTVAHWYFRANGKLNGLICRHCRQAIGKKAPAKCKHCHKPIIGRTAQTTYHNDSDHPDCKAAYKTHKLEIEREYYFRVRKSRPRKAPEAIKKGDKICERCGKRKVHKDLRKTCYDCYHKGSYGRTDDNYIYWDSSGICSTTK
jgi:hypothetical protein